MNRSRGRVGCTFEKNSSKNFKNSTIITRIFFLFETRCFVRRESRKTADFESDIYGGEGREEGLSPTLECFKNGFSWGFFFSSFKYLFTFLDKKGTCFHPKNLRLFIVTRGSPRVNSWLKKLGQRRPCIFVNGVHGECSRALVLDEV